MNEPTFRAIAPIFQVANLQRSIDYYTRIMGFELGWTAGEPPDRASFCRDSVEITVEDLDGNEIHIGAPLESGTGA